MDVIPLVAVIRFEQLEPGDLFLYMDGRYSFYALKTAVLKNGDRNEMVLLGPTFLREVMESFLFPCQPVNVLSLGKNYSIILPTDPASWSLTGPERKPVCLAIADTSIYICTNCGPSPQHYVPCFVDVKTGAVFEGRPPGLLMFTNSWEIAILGANHPPRSILKYPLA